MTIHILLPVHNRNEITRTFVDCLTAQTYRDYRLILIDDGSTDGTEAMVRERVDALTVLRGRGDWWWAGSLQAGLDRLARERIADDALILFINDDVRFEPDYLARAVEVMSGKKGVFMLSQFRSTTGGRPEETGMSVDLRRLVFSPAKQPEQINCLSTRGLFARYADVRAVGGFHPVLLPHYLSDYEYTIRAHRKGFKCETSPELVLEPNHETSGYRTFDESSFLVFLKKYFSKRSASNPLYWSTFALLACRPRWIVPNLVRLWRNELRNIMQALSASRRARGGSH